MTTMNSEHDRDTRRPRAVSARVTPPELPVAALWKHSSPLGTWILSLNVDNYFSERTWMFSVACHREHSIGNSYPRTRSNRTKNCYIPRII